MLFVCLPKVCVPGAECTCSSPRAQGLAAGPPRRGPWRLGVARARSALRGALCTRRCSTVLSCNAKCLAATAFFRRHTLTGALQKLEPGGPWPLCAHRSRGNRRHRDDHYRTKQRLHQKQCGHRVTTSTIVTQASRHCALSGTEQAREQRIQSLQAQRRPCQHTGKPARAPQPHRPITVPSYQTIPQARRALARPWPSGPEPVALWP